MVIRAVVFDLFDTLVDLLYEQLPMIERDGMRMPASTQLLHAAVRERADVDFERFIGALVETDRGFRETHYAEGRELPTHERFSGVLDHLGVHDDELAGILTAVHMGILREHVSVPEHHADVLAQLSRRVRLGLCSNFSHAETAHAVLEEAGFHEYLDAIAISESVGIRKPRREIFEAVLTELDVAPEETLHVGDHLRSDVGGAHALGIHTAWITRRVTDADDTLESHEGPDPEWRIHDIAELPALLARDLSGA